MRIRSDYVYNDNRQQCRTVGHGVTVETLSWNGVDLTRYHIFENLVDPDRTRRTRLLFDLR